MVLVDWQAQQNEPKIHDIQTLGWELDAQVKEIFQRMAKQVGREQSSQPCRGQPEVAGSAGLGVREADEGKPHRRAPCWRVAGAAHYAQARMGRAYCQGVLPGPAQPARSQCERRRR